LIYIFNQGHEKLIAIIQDPLTNKIRQMDILMIDEEELPWDLLYFGSDKEFSKKIRKIAIEKGYKLSEKGLFDRKSGKRIDFHPKDEKEIFTFLQIPYIPPSKRI
jgi:DNA polymerase (family 10)